MSTSAIWIRLSIAGLALELLQAYFLIHDDGWNQDDVPVATVRAAQLTASIPFAAPRRASRSSPRLCCGLANDRWPHVPARAPPPRFACFAQIRSTR